MKSGDMTRFGAIQALTWQAHESEDADFQYELESKAIGVLENFSKYDVNTILKQSKQ